MGFDVGFKLEHMREIAKNFFGRKIVSEMQVLREQISILQDTFVVLATYQEELMFAGETTA